MAVQTSSKSVYDDDFEDEDGPTIFKRSKPMARQNQLNSGSKEVIIRKARWTIQWSKLQFAEG